MTNKTSISSFDDDFGFTFATEADIVQEAGFVNETEELTSRLQRMYDSILPLLKNLSKNPDQDFIKWPNRTTKIQEFKNKLDAIGGEFIKTKELK